MKTHHANDLLIESMKDHLAPYLQKLHDHSIENRCSKIEVFGTTDGKDGSLFTLISMDIHNEWRQIYISKIYLPIFMRHHGIGKKLIRVIYETAKQLKYELFIIMMTDSFYNRMRKRGALECEVPDMVKIVESTKLE